MIGIVAESLSCMTIEDKNFDNCVIAPAYCTVDNKTYADSVKEYPYGFKKVITRAPTANDYYKIFNTMLEEYKEIICFTSSKKISASYENAVIAAKACQGNRITVIDTGATAGSLHMLVKLCRALEAIGVGYTDILKIIERQKDSIVTTFTIGISALKEGKRTGILKSECSMPILNQRPILTFDTEGSIVMKKNASGTINLIRELLEPHKNTSPRRIIVYYSDITSQLKEVLKEVHAAFRDADIMTRRVSHAIRATTGDNLICVTSHSM